MSGNYRGGKAGVCILGETILSWFPLPQGKVSWELEEAHDYIFRLSCEILHRPEEFIKEGHLRRRELLDQKYRSEKISNEIAETEDRKLVLIKAMRTELTVTLSLYFAVSKSDMGLGICASRRCHGYKGWGAKSGLGCFLSSVLCRVTDRDRNSRESKHEIGKGDVWTQQVPWKSSCLTLQVCHPA